MQRFTPGDPVLILPKFAHLYPASAAVVVSARVNNFRPTLNEYTVEFADHSRATVLEFQIIDNRSSFTTAIARVIFDSRQQPAATQTRGSAPGFQMILQTAQFDLDMTIKATKSRAAIMGQVLERSTKTLLKNFDVTLLKDGTPIANTKADVTGIFNFRDVARGEINVLVLISQSSSRILGTVVL